jgi:hypothetical protein
VTNDAKSIIFNSFFVSAFGLYTNNAYDNYNYVIIFSYPDSKDFPIDLIKHLKNNEYDFPLNYIVQNLTTINNNLFGLVIKGIKIQSFPQYNGTNAISLYSNNKNDLIKKDDIIDRKEKIKFYFPQSELSSGEYIMEYAGVVTEPDFDEFNKYCEIDSLNGNINQEKSEFQKYDYVGKTRYISIKVNDSLTGQCTDETCFYCLQNDKDNCVSFKKQNKNEAGLDEKELTKIYNKLKEIIEQKSYNGEKVELKMQDVLVQLTTLKFQENNINDKNSTNVILGECEEILKQKYKLQDDELLLMLKLNLFKPSSSTPLVEYELYNYNKSQKLNLEYCNNISINIFFPVYLDQETIQLYDNLNSSGYNLFDSNDSFYNDICSRYTTVNGTDITLSDRQKEFYDENLRLCQEDGCAYDYYDSTLNKAKCHCPISKISTDKSNTTNMQEDISIISSIVEIYNNKSEIFKIFSSSIKNINFKVMKCYKLVFNLDIMKTNIGSILLTCFIIIFLVLMIIYFIEGNKILKKILENAYKTQFIKEDNKNENLKNRKKEIESKIKKKERSKFEKKKTTTYKNKNAKILENSDEEKIEKNESPYLKKKSKNDTTRRINKSKLNSKNSLFSNKNKNKEFKNILKINLKKGEKGQILNNIKKNYSTKNKVFLKIRQKDIIRKNNKFKKIKKKKNSLERKN